MANQGVLDNDKLFSVAPVKQHKIKEDALNSKGLPKNINNCFPCVLKFFEIINHEQYMYLSGRPNFGLHSIKDIEAVYDLIDQGGNYKFVKVNKDNKNFDLNIVFEKLNRSHGTLIGVKNENGAIGHCMLFAKDNNGEHYLIDPQAEQFYKGFDQIIGFLSNHNITKLFCLFDENQIDRDMELITAEISGIGLGKKRKKKFKNIFYFKKQKSSNKKRTSLKKRKSLINKKKKKRKSLKKNFKDLKVKKNKPSAGLEPAIF